MQQQQQQAMAKVPQPKQFGGAPPFPGIRPPMRPGIGAIRQPIPPMIRPPMGQMPHGMRGMPMGGPGAPPMDNQGRMVGRQMQPMHNAPHSNMQVSATNGQTASAMVKQQKSVAEQLLSSTRIAAEIQNELKKSVFISKIPKQASNLLLERLLKACGSLISWKRSTANPDKPQSFGLAEFDCIESVFACLKTMNNLKLYENNILVKADTKTQEFLVDWVQASQTRWLDKQQKAGTTIDPETLAEQTKKGMVLPHEKQLIPHYEEIKLEFKETLEEHGAAKIPSTMKWDFGSDQRQVEIDDTKQKAAENSSYGGPNDKLIPADHRQSQRSPSSRQAQDHSQRKVGMSMINSENVFIDDTLANKYKDNEREIRRQQRYNQMLQDNENRFRKKLKDWLQREQARDQAKLRESERAEQREKERQRHIQKDREYDEVAERKKKKRDIKAFQRLLTERRRIREREQEDDLADTRLEQDEVAAQEREKLEQQRVVEEKRKREEEIKERMKIKKFMEMQDEMEKQQKAKEEQEALAKVLEEQSIAKKRQKLSQTEDQEVDKKQSRSRSNSASSSSGSDSASSYSSDSDSSSSKSSKERDENKNNVVSVAAPKEIVETAEQKAAKEEAKKKLQSEILSKSREIYLSLPQGKDQVYSFQLDYDALKANSVIDRVVRPWVAKKIKEYLGVEEEAMIRLVLNCVTNQLPAQTLYDKVAPILDDVAENFVLKLWQVMLFEHEKISKGVYQLQEDLKKFQ